MLKILLGVSAMALLSACADTRQEAHERAALARGHELALSHCSSCHAIETSGDSAAPEAPAFRTLSRHYRVDTLETALSQGISAGHPAMPEFQFSQDDVHALVSYLQSIQDDRDAAPANPTH